MRLVSLNIKNFGNLNGFSCSFDNGMNTLLQENGWGKTTLCTFIKAMFYGMPVSELPDEENERKFYKPWKGGVYGGNLVFETDDKKIYRIERSFGDKEIGDSFVLYDEKTGSRSEDFTENIGEELFQIDRASFERSIMVPQNLTAPKATGSINAKLTNLMHSGNDIDVYDNADQALDTAMQRLRSGNRGELEQLKQMITLSRGEVERLKNDEQEYRNKGNEIQQYYRSRTEMTIRLKVVSDELNRAARYEECVQKGKNYRELCREEQAEKEKVEAQEKGFFAFAGIPEESEVKAASDCLNDELKVRAQAEGNILTDDEEKFYLLANKMLRANLENEKKNHPDIFDKKAMEKKAEIDANRDPLEALDDIPGKKAGEETEKYVESANPERDDDLLASASRCIKRHRNIHVTVQANRKRLKQLEESERDYKRLQKQYANLTPEEDMKRTLAFEQDMNKIDEAIQELRDKIDEVHEQEAKAKSVIVPPQKNKIVLMIVLGVIVIIAAVVGALLLKQPAIFGLILVGVMFFIYAFTIKKTVDGQIVQLLREQDKFGERVEEIEEQIAIQESHKSEVFHFVKLLLFRYEVDDAEDMPTLQDEIRKRYEAFTRSKQALKDIKKERAELEAELKTDEERIGKEMVCFLPILEEGAAKDSITYAVEEKIIQRYPDVSRRRDLYRALSDELNKITEPSRKFFGKYFPAMKKDLDSISQIRVEMSKHTQLMENYKASSARKKQFEENNNLDEIRAVVSHPVENKEGLASEKKSLEERLEAVNNHITKIEPECRRLEEQANRLGEEEQGLTYLEKQASRKEEDYQIYSRTKELLAKAKSNFAVRYLRKLNDGFDRYMTCVDNHTAIGSRAGKDEYGYTIDEQLQIQVETDGNMRDYSSMSTGYQDIIAVCMRLALVDAMFEKESPFIILDDPFVNLDSAKLEKAKDLMKGLSMTRQVIYFTCHESRK